MIFAGPGATNEVDIFQAHSNSNDIIVSGITADFATFTATTASTTVALDFVLQPDFTQATEGMVISVSGALQTGFYTATLDGIANIIAGGGADTADLSALTTLTGSTFSLGADGAMTLVMNDKNIGVPTVTAVLSDFDVFKADSSAGAVDTFDLANSTSGSVITIVAGDGANSVDSIINGPGTVVLLDHNSVDQATIIGANFQDVYTLYGGNGGTDENNFYASAGSSNSTLIASFGGHPVLTVSSEETSTTITMGDELSTLTFGGVAGTDSFSNIETIFAGEGLGNFSLIAGSGTVTAFGGLGSNYFYAGEGHGDFWGSENGFATNELNVGNIADLNSVDISPHGADPIVSFVVGGGEAGYSVTLDDASVLALGSGNGAVTVYDEVGDFTLIGNNGADTFENDSGSSADLFIVTSSSALDQLSIQDEESGNSLELSFAAGTGVSLSASDFSGVDSSISDLLLAGAGTYTLTLDSSADSDLIASVTSIDLSHLSGAATVNLADDGAQDVTVFAGTGSENLTADGNMADILSFGADTLAATVDLLTSPPGSDTFTEGGVTNSFSGFQSLVGNGFNDALLVAVPTSGLSEAAYANSIGSDISGFATLDLAVSLHGSTEVHIHLSEADDTQVFSGLDFTSFSSGNGTVNLQASGLIDPLTITTATDSSVTLLITGPEAANFIDVANVGAATVNGGAGDTVEINASVDFADGGMGTNTLIVDGADLTAGSTIDIALGGGEDTKTDIFQNLSGAPNAQFFTNFSLASGGTEGAYVEGYNQLDHTIVMSGSGNDTLVGGFGNNYLEAGTGSHNVLIEDGGSTTTQVMVGQAGSADTLEANSVGSNITLMLAGTITGNYTFESVSSAASLTAAGDYLFTGNALDADIEGTGSDFTATFLAAGTTSSLVLYSGTDMVTDVFTDNLTESAASSDLVLASDLTLGGTAGATYDINLGAGGGYVDIPSDTGSVTITSDGAVTVALDIDTTASISANLADVSGNELILSGLVTDTALLVDLAGTNSSDATAIDFLPNGSGALTISDGSYEAFTDVNASAVSGAAGFGLILGDPHTDFNETLIGSQGSDILVGGGGSDNTFVSTSGHDTIIANASGDYGGTALIEIMPGSGPHSDFIDIVGGYTYYTENGSVTFESSHVLSGVSDNEAGATVDLSNLGNPELAIAGFARVGDANLDATDLVLYLSGAAGGGTVDIAGYFSQDNDPVYLVGQDSLSGGSDTGSNDDQITFATTDTLNATSGSWAIIGDGGDGMTSNLSHTAFYMAGGTNVEVVDTGDSGRVDFSLYDTTVVTGTTGILVDYSGGSGQTGTVFSLSGSEFSTLWADASNGLAALESDIGSSSSGYESLAAGTNGVYAELNGIDSVTGTNTDNLFIGPQEGDNVDFAAVGGNNIYINTDPTQNLVSVDYSSSPGDIAVNLDDTVADEVSTVGGITVTLAAGEAFNGWGTSNSSDATVGFDSLIGTVTDGTTLMPNDIIGPAGDAIIWGGSEGFTFEAGAGFATLIGLATSSLISVCGGAGAYNEIDFENQGGRLLGGNSVDDTDMAGIGVNLNNVTETIGANTLVANTGYNSSGTTDALTDINVAVGTGYNDIMVGSSTIGTTLVGQGGDNHLYGFDTSATASGNLTWASYQDSNSAIIVNFSTSDVTEVFTNVVNCATTYTTVTLDAASTISGTGAFFGDTVYLVDNGLGGTDSLVGINAVQGSNTGGDTIFSDSGLETYIGNEGDATLFLLSTADLTSDSNGALSSNGTGDLQGITNIDLSNDNSTVMLNLAEDTNDVTVTAGLGVAMLIGNCEDSLVLDGSTVMLEQSVLLVADTVSTSGIEIQDSAFSSIGTDPTDMVFSLVGATANGVDLTGGSDLAGSSIHTIDLSNLVSLTNTIDITQADNSAVTIIGGQGGEDNTITGNDLNTTLSYQDYFGAATIGLHDDGAGGGGGAVEQLTVFNDTATGYSDSFTGINTLIGPEGNAAIFINYNPDLSDFTLESGGGYDTLTLTGLSGDVSSGNLNLIGNFPTITFEGGETIDNSVDSVFDAVSVQLIDMSITGSGGSLDLSLMDSSITVDMANTPYSETIAAPTGSEVFTLIDEGGGGTVSVSGFSSSDFIQFSTDLGTDASFVVSPSSSGSNGDWNTSVSGGNELVTATLDSNNGNIATVSLIGFDALSSSQVAFDVEFTDTGTSSNKVELATGGGIVTWDDADFGNTNDTLLGGGVHTSSELAMTGTMATSLDNGEVPATNISIDLTQMSAGNSNDVFQSGGAGILGATLASFTTLDLSDYAISSGDTLTVYAESTDSNTYTLIGGAPGEVSGQEILEGSSYAGAINVLYGGGANETLIGGGVGTDNTFVLFNGAQPTTNNDVNITIESTGSNFSIDIPAQYFAGLSANETPVVLSNNSSVSSYAGSKATILIAPDANNSSNTDIYYYVPHDPSHNGSSQSYQIATIVGESTTAVSGSISFTNPHVHPIHAAA